MGTCMGPLVDLEVLTAGEYLATAGEGTGEGLLSCMNPDVVDQLVLGLEGTTAARTAVPEARVCRALRSTNMLHCQVSHYLVHGVEGLATRLARARPVYPQTTQVLHWLHVPEERTRLVAVVGVGLVSVGSWVVDEPGVRLVYGLGVVQGRAEAQDVPRGCGWYELLVVSPQQEVPGGVARVVQMVGVVIAGVGLVEVMLRLLHPHHLTGPGRVRGAHLQPHTRWQPVPMVRRLHKRIYHFGKAVLCQVQHDEKLTLNHRYFR